MIRIGLIAVAVGALALPAGAAGDPPTQENRKDAAKHCKSMRAAAETRLNFAQMVEDLQPGDQVNANGKNAYGQCVKFHARDERNEEARAQRSASRECREMREQNPEAFGRGPNAQWRNLGQCVSQKRRENKAEADRKDRNQVNAARECRAEQEQDEATFRSEHNGESFAEFYGDNANNRNAFGKCVSQKARAKNEEQGQAS
jgi:hypothetical protein